MSRPRLARTAAGFAAAATLVGAALVPALTPAHAAGTPVSNAADYIVKTFVPSNGTSPGSDIDAFFGLVAAGPAYSAPAQKAYDSAMIGCGATTLPVGTAYGNGSPSSAAKCALAAEVKGDMATAKAYLQPYVGYNYTGEYMFGIGLEATAFLRAGLPLPTTLDAALVAAGTPVAGKLPLDAVYGKQLDAAGQMFAAMKKLPAPSAADVTATTNIQNYILSNQQADGSWLDFSPVNTTGMVAPAIGLVNATAAAKGKAYVTSKQFADGGLPNSPTATASDLRATNQGIFALAGTTLFDLGFAAAATPTPTPTPSPSPTPTAPVLNGTATPLAVATEADCVAQKGVWVVVDNNGTVERRGCVAITGTPSDLAVLRALTPAVVTQATKYGEQICTIDGIGDCLFTNKQYWGFYVSQADGTWGYAQTGAGATAAVPGSAISYSWGTNAAMPAIVAGADAPLPVVATPTPTPTPTSTSAPVTSPTPTPTPTPTVSTTSTVDATQTAPADAPATTTTSDTTSTATDATAPNLADTGGDSALLVVLGLGTAVVGGTVLTRRAK